jgi:transcriptional regulator with XRE-family HTH domain
MAPNELLRARIAARGWRPSDLAARVQVDAKTVERWIHTGRVPHRTTRWSVAQALGVDELTIWPEVADHQGTRAASQAELVAVYPNRGQVPPALWTSMIRDSAESISLLVYAGLFWFDAHADLCDLLKARADAGVQVRLALGDPDAPAIATRGVEEGIDMAARTRLTLGLIGPIVGHPGIEVRLHATTLYASLYRADDALLANTHVLGSPALHSPVLHLQRIPGGQMFDHYAASFERAWASARRYEIP